MSNKIYKKSLFIFRRDLRLFDNTGLIHALKQSDIVIPCFIFDPAQVTNQNEFKSNNGIQFMIESLKELNEQLKAKNSALFLFYGNPENIVKDIIKTENIDAIFLNKDYTPFSINRDKKIEHICNQYNIVLNQFNDILLTDPDKIKTINGDEYKIFTPFFKNISKLEIESPIKNNYTNFYKSPIKNQENENVYKTILKKTNNKIHINGGTSEAKKILNSLKKFKNYKMEKNFPYLATTNLSAHLKFGTCSIRETYHAICEQLGQNHELIRQLFWRDFFTYIAYHRPFVFGQSFKNKYNSIKWQNNEILFEKWCNGKTGFPLIDAGMRQLNESGYMHNRVRLIVSSFLVKDLHIDWRWGEKYFGQNLVDYDPSVNNGNWQWIASTGSDAQPYFRIFNPWLQQKKFDPNCIYIKKWVKELKDADPKIIHSLYKNNLLIKNYEKPIVDHNKESIKAKKMYKS